jgi:probable F420-dependent oxidoreductase
MKVGIVFPQTEIGADPIVLRDFAQTAEGLGFSHILAFDHVLGVEHADREPPLTGPYTEASTFHEPLTLFAHWAAMTTDIGFATGVLVLPQRQAPLVAKQAAEVAILSGDRLRLGIGVGWNHVEYAGMGAEWSGRGARQEEQVELMRRLWTGEVLTFEGRWHRIDRAALAPAPTRPVPVWFGGFSDAAHDRAARMGDGFLFARVGERVSGGRPTQAVETVLEQADRMRARVAELGRDPQSFQVEGRVNLRDDPALRRAECEAFREAGFDYLAVNTMTAGLDSPAAHVAALHEIAKEFELS